MTPNTIESTYIRWCKRLNTHLLGILVATTSGAALNIATGSVSNIFHILSIATGVFATVLAFLLFLWRNNIDEDIEADVSSRTSNENFERYCRYDESGVVKTFFCRLWLFILSFCAIIIFMYFGAVQAGDDDQKSQQEVVAQSLESIKDQLRKQQEIIDSQHATILALAKKIETQTANPASGNRPASAEKIKKGGKKL